MAKISLFRHVLPTLWFGGAVVYFLGYDLFQHDFQWVAPLWFFVMLYLLAPWGRLGYPQTDMERKAYEAANAVKEKQKAEKELKERLREKIRTGQYRKSERG